MSDYENGVMKVSRMKRINYIESDESEIEVTENENAMPSRKKGKPMANNTINNITETQHIEKFRFTEWALKPLKKRSDSNVWSHYGQVFDKFDKKVESLAKKIICRTCFENRK